MHTPAWAGANPACLSGPPGATTSLGPGTANLTLSQAVTAQSCHTLSQLLGHPRSHMHTLGCTRMCVNRYPHTKRPGHHLTPHATGIPQCPEPWPPLTVCPRQAQGHHSEQHRDRQFVQRSPRQAVGAKGQTEGCDFRSALPAPMLGCFPLSLPPLSCPPHQLGHRSPQPSQQSPDHPALQSASTDCTTATVALRLGLGARAAHPLVVLSVAPGTGHRAGWGQKILPHCSSGAGSQG